VVLCFPGRCLGRYKTEVTKTVVSLAVLFPQSPGPLGGDPKLGPSLLEFKVHASWTGRGETRATEKYYAQNFSCDPLVGGSFTETITKPGQK
jgi:hypothetical protein